MDSETLNLEAARAAAIAADRCFSKGRLRDEFRMKPRPGAQPVKEYKNEFGGTFGVYRVADCVPLRQVASRAPTERELRARAAAAIRGKLRSDKAVAGQTALEWLADDPLVLDTETTGLGYQAQIVELAIINAAGEVVLETRLRPTVPIEAGAERVHGIGAADLARAPSWPDVAAEIEALLTGRTVVIFNARFDKGLLRQTAEAFGDRAQWLDTVRTRCAMYLAAEAYGPTNSHGTISLANAMDDAGVEWRGPAHSAAADALAALDVVKAIAKYRRGLEAELERLLTAG